MPARPQYTKWPGHCCLSLSSRTGRWLRSGPGWVSLRRRVLGFVLRCEEHGVLAALTDTFSIGKSISLHVVTRPIMPSGQSSQRSRWPKAAWVGLPAGVISLQMLMPPVTADVFATPPLLNPSQSYVGGMAGSACAQRGAGDLTVPGVNDITGFVTTGNGTAKPATLESAGPGVAVMGGHTKAGGTPYVPFL